jgi:hypothetical protein
MSHQFNPQKIPKAYIRLEDADGCAEKPICRPAAAFAMNI